MTRYFTRVTAVWPSGSPTSSALTVPWGHVAGGVVHISGAWTNAHIGLQQNVFGTWHAIKDWQAGYTGVSIASASGNVSHQCPPSWFYANGKDHQVKLWSHDGTGSGVPQAAARTVVLDLKG